MSFNRLRAMLCILGVLACTLLPALVHATALPLGDAADYAVLYEGTGGHTLHITNVTIDGNIGVGGTGQVQDSGPSTITGRLDFSAANTSQFSSTGSNVGPTSVNYNVAEVTSALSTVNSLSTTPGSETGTSLAINVSSGDQTINASAGTLDGSGDRVFTITSFASNNGHSLIINGDVAGDSVVLNFPSALGNINFNNEVVLNGLSPNQVLFNFLGSNTLQINTNASSFHSQAAQGIFLDPNGPISVVNANVNGRIFGGDSHDMQIVSGDTIIQPIPEPASVLLLGAGLAGLGLWTWRRRLADARERTPLC